MYTKFLGISLIGEWTIFKFVNPPGCKFPFNYKGIDC